MLLLPEVLGVCACVLDTELTIKSALFFCIDIKHCDVYYANVYSNAEIKTYKGYSFALGTDQRLN